jgi:Flp pilus assembly protein CpaB
MSSSPIIDISSPVPGNSTSPATKSILSNKGLLIGAAAVGAITQFLLFQSITETADRGMVLVATVPLKPTEQFHPETATFDVLVKPDQASNFVTSEEASSFSGYYFTKQLDPGMPIQKSALSKNHNSRTSVMNIPPGKVLFALNAKLGPLAGVVTSGMTVDLMAQMNIPGSGYLMETLLSNTKIVALGMVSAEASKKTALAAGSDSVSFYVTPEEMKLLTYAQKFSEFSLVVRNQKESLSDADKAPMTLNRFLANPKIQKAMSSDLFQIRNGSEEDDSTQNLGGLEK